MGYKTAAFFVYSAFTWAVAATANAEAVNFPGARAAGFAYTETVTGTFNLPAKPDKKMPAILILHGSGGIDGRGGFHAKALNEAGFATLEIFMFPPGGRNKEGHESTLTHAFGALKYLASRPDVDPKRIGAMGFSWGGNMTLKLASEKIRLAFMADTGDARFGALASFYPVCWTHLATATSENPEIKAKFTTLTGAKLLLLAGGQDDYGAPDDCQKFVAALPETAQQLVSLQYYPEATHGWDSPSGRDRTIQDPTANQGRGGSVRMYANAKIAEDSRKQVVEHFKKNLSPI